MLARAAKGYHCLGRLVAAKYLRVAALAEFRLVVHAVSSLLALAGALHQSAVLLLPPWQMQLSALPVPPYCDYPESLPFAIDYRVGSTRTLANSIINYCCRSSSLLGKTARCRAHSPARNQSSSHVKPRPRRLCTVPYHIIRHMPKSLNHQPS